MARPSPPVLAMTWVPEISLRQLQSNLATNGPELYVGTDGRRLIWAGPQQALLVLGPPRSGKTSTLVVPNVLAAPGPVLVTSTKPDILQATLASRSERGRCWWLDPSGTVEAPPGTQPLRWSPVAAAYWWEHGHVCIQTKTTEVHSRDTSDPTSWALPRLVELAFSYRHAPPTTSYRE